MKRGWLLLCSTLFVIFSAILYHSWPHERSCFDVDSRTYEKFATFFEQSGSLADPVNKKNFPVVSLGYSLIMGSIYKIIGHQYRYIIFFQILLSLLSLWLVFLIAERFFTRSVALIASFLCSINLGFLVYAQFLLTEIVLITLLLACIERLSAFLSFNTPRSLAFSGLFLGLAVVIKPAPFFYAFLVVLFLFLFLQGNIIAKSKIIGVFFLCFFVPIVLYSCSIYIMHGRTDFFVLGKVNLYCWFLPKVLSKTDAISQQQAGEMVSDLIRKAERQGLDSWYFTKAVLLQRIFNFPLICIYIWLKNVFKTFVGLYATQLKVLLGEHVEGGDWSFFKIKEPSVLVRAYLYIIGGTNSTMVRFIGFGEFFYSIIRYIFVLIAFAFFFLTKSWLYFYFFGSYILYFSFITGHDGCGRFRMMFEPMLIILTAVGLVVVYLWLYKKNVKKILQF